MELQEQDWGLVNSFHFVGMFQIYGAFGGVCQQSSYCILIWVVIDIHLWMIQVGTFSLLKKTLSSAGGSVITGTIFWLPKTGWFSCFQHRRIAEALFFTVWEGGRPGPIREDWHVSWAGSVYARSWTSRRDAGRGIPQLQVLRAWACQILITFVHHSAFVVVYIWWSYCAICYLYSVFSDEKLAACSWITDQLIKAGQ